MESSNAPTPAATGDQHQNGKPRKLLQLSAKAPGVNVDKATIAAFLRAVFGLDDGETLPEGSCIGIVKVSASVVQRVHCATVELAAEVIASTGPQANVYFETSLGPAIVKGGRLSKAEAISTAHVRLDIDFQSPHRGVGKSYPADKAEALELLEPLLQILPPSFEVNSGFGIQLYWTFKEPVDLLDAKDRITYIRASMTVHLFAKRLLARDGYDLDNVTDLARLMRAPGSFNIKDSTSPRFVTSEDCGHRYASPEDILENLPEIEIDVPEDAKSNVRIGDFASKVVRNSAARKIKLIMEVEAELQIGDQPGSVTSAWNRERLYSDDSQSAHDWKMLSCLVASGEIFTVEELAAALVLYRNACADKLESRDPEQAKIIREKVSRQDYIARTVGKVVSATGVILQDGQEPGEATEEVAIGEQEEVELPLPEAKTAHIKPHVVKEGESPATLDYCHALLTSDETPVRYRAFQRAGNLVTLTVFEDCAHEEGIERQAGITMLRQAEKNWLLHVAAKFGMFEKYDNRKKKNKRIEPPTYVGERLLATVGLYQYPVLRAISHGPVMSRDGSIVCEEGYHKNLKIYCKGDVKVTVKEKPNRSDALASLANIKSLLREFPFKNDAHRSAAISMIISAVIRLMLRLTPLFMVTANKHGAGKTTLVHVASIIATGTKATAIAATDHQEEFRKRLDTVLLEGDQIVNLDNLNWDLESETLAQAVSEPYVSIRVLGKNEQRRVENTALFIANGNNLNVAKDLARRTVVVRLDAEMERPDLREFESDVLEEAFKRRTELLESVFTIVRAYINNVLDGQERIPEMWPWGGFNDFTKYVRGPLVWLKEPDPCITCSEATVESADDEDRRNLFETWYDKYGQRPVKVKDLVAYAIEHSDSVLALCLRAVARKHKDYNDIDPLKLSRWLSSSTRMVVAGLQLHNQPDPKHGAKWIITKL